MTLAAGARVGPYDVLGPLGAGGMGEVWRARDSRLGREVALKLLPAELASDPDRLRRFEQEARATAALSHPNILAIFDVGSHEGISYLVEELLEGETLAGRIHAGDLTVGRAVALALQVARGLAAAHDRGIVHRDLKPDNVFVTRDGVVKILDFGLAKLTAGRPLPELETVTDGPRPSETGLVVGTPAYMAPEQARGRVVDHRADLFSLGVVLYEMLAGVRPFSGDSHADLVASILTRDPPPLPGSVPRALQGVVSRCLEKRPEDRFSTARDVAYALEAALESTPARVKEQRREEPRPYPGLQYFSEADAERFFGREEEVAALWRKVPERSLLALIGPSGAGKTSLVRAGLVAHAPPRWRCLVATPGQAPFAGLARALAPHFAGDADAFQQLIDFHRPEVGPALVARWAEGCDGALVVVDQLEELFTLNGEEVQARFAELLGRLAELPGVHVLLSLRDDFLLRCNAYAALKPVFFDLTPLDPPAGGALRRAVVEPARRLGFAFEDDSLVDEMLEAVEGERGALPLLAFAVSRLWEERDRERKLLTRDTYVRVGGVAGALAQQAEATLEKLGDTSVPIVRELFRNLATGAQTRCVLEWGELLSVFPAEQRPEAERVLAALVDARLVTSFELEGADGSWHHRVEVVHESLLRSWPRLVRWQTQDADSLQLRDQLRQAARLWDERGSPEDLLWTGNAVTEYALWRSRYPGGLSAVEGAFGDAIVALGGRRRRRRRIAVAATLLVLAGVLAVVGTSLRRTRAALRRTDASRLVALGRAAGVEADPTAVLAYAMASLERADSPDARMLALDAMAHGPIAFVADDRYPWVAFSPDGRWLCAELGGEAWVWSKDGSRSVFRVGVGDSRGLFFPPDGSALIAVYDLLRAWQLPGGALLGEVVQDSTSWPSWTVVFTSPGDGPRLGVLELGTGSAVLHTLPLRRSAAPGALRFDLSAWFDDPPTYQLEWDRELQTFPAEPAVDPMGQWLAVPVGREVVLQPLAGGAPARVLARHEARVCWLEPSPDGRALAARDEAGGIRLWSVATGEETARLDGGDSFYRTFGADGASFITIGAPTVDGARTIRVWRLGEGSADPGRSIGLPAGYEDCGEVTGFIRSDRRARWVTVPNVNRPSSLWNLGWPAEAGPVTLRREPSAGMCSVSVHPDGTWVAAAAASGTAIWPLEERTARTLVGHRGRVLGLAFAPDGSWLASTSLDLSLRLWPLVGDPPPAARVLLERPHPFGFPALLEASADGRFLAMGSARLGGALVSTEGVVRQLPGFAGRAMVVTLSDDGRLAAAGGNRENEAFVRVWELATGREVARLDAGDGKPIQGVLFLAGGGLVSWGSFGIRLHDVAAGSVRPLWVPDDAHADHVDVVRRSSADLLAFVLVDPSVSGGRAYLLEPATGTVRRLASHGDRVAGIALDESGAVVATGSAEGVVRVGPAAGGPPHLLLGHTGLVNALAISRRGDWLASGGADGMIRLWPMPDLSKPPAHTLPLPELLAKLESQTNLRAVSDAAAPGGYRLVPGPFPGWATVPEWQP